ncbi:MAG: nitroreductase family protein [Candidatus Zhuqueibacterota bacterium]
MAGIVFFRTRDLKSLRDFYTDQIRMQVWLEQKDCLILKHGNMLLGFCQRDEPDTGGIITFFYPSDKEVDSMYHTLQSIAVAPPTRNDVYSIYQFFARDRENRLLEFQSFSHELPPFLPGDELLLTRRSTRHFLERKIPGEILSQVSELCRFAPTSRNSQSYYFVVIEEPAMLNFLASRREGNSAPIGRAPLAVAICTDNEKTLRPEQDACIAAYHFMLSAWNFGLGTCWIAAMDREDVKQALGIPQSHYIATVTPLGYPADIPAAPHRKQTTELVRFIR